MATDQVIPGNGAAVTVNANFEAGRAAMMYGRRASTTGTPTALTWGYYGGQYAPGVSVPDGTLTLTNSATNYIVADRATGAVSSSTGTTNWNDSTNYIQLYEVTAAGGVVTAYIDRRPSVYAPSGGGGGSGTVTSIDVAGGVGLDSSGGPVTTSGTITLDLDSASQASLALADSALQSVQAGTGISIDNTDPQNPVIAATGGGGSQAGIQFQDEGSNLGASGTVDTVDFVGSGVTASRVGNTLTVTVSGGGGGGGGDVVGPSSATDNALARFDTTTGKLIKNSGVLVDNDDKISGYYGNLNKQTGTTYTLQASDSGKVVLCTNAAAITVTVPNSLKEGFNCTVVQGAAGQVTIAAGAGATSRNPLGNKTPSQWRGPSVLVHANVGGSAADFLILGDATP